MTPSETRIEPYARYAFFFVQPAIAEDQDTRTIGTTMLSCTPFYKRQSTLELHLASHEIAATNRRGDPDGQP